MSQEIKFRIWIKESNRFIYFNVLEILTNVKECDKNSIQQYIGIEDKDGVPIYVGDKIAGTYEGIVEYRENYCDYAIMSKRSGCKRINLYKGIQKKIKVVGNILENKDIIK